MLPCSVLWDPSPCREEFNVEVGEENGEDTDELGTEAELDLDAGEETETGADELVAGAGEDELVTEAGAELDEELGEGKVASSHTLG